MLNFLLKHLFKFALGAIGKKVNLPPNIANTVNSLFNTNFNQIPIDVKTDRKQLIKLLLQTTSQAEADKIREVLKEQERKKQLPEKILCLAGVIGAIILPFSVESKELVESIFVSIIIIIAVVKYQSYRTTKFYQCEYCFTTSNISEYEVVNLNHTGTTQQVSSQNRYMGYDNFSHYYTTDHYQTVTHHYDRLSKCPCCGYKQVIKVRRSQTSQI